VDNKIIFTQIDRQEQQLTSIEESRNGGETHTKSNRFEKS